MCGNGGFRRFKSEWGKWARPGVISLATLRSLAWMSAATRTLASAHSLHSTSKPLLARDTVWKTRVNYRTVPAYRVTRYSSPMVSIIGLAEPACRRPASAPGTSARPVSWRGSSPGHISATMCVGAPGERPASVRFVRMNVSVPTTRATSPRP